MFKIIDSYSSFCHAFCDLEFLQNLIAVASIFIFLFALYIVLAAFG